MSRTLRSIAPLFLIALCLILLLPTTALAEAPASDLNLTGRANATLTTQAEKLPPVTNLRVTEATPKDDGTFNMRIDWDNPAGRTLRVEVSIVDPSGTVARYGKEVKAESISYLYLDEVPGAWGGKAAEITVTRIASPYFLDYNEDSDPTTISYTFPAAYSRPSTADLVRMASASVTTTDTKYGGALKKGAKRVWKHGLYTLSAEVTNVKGSECTIAAQVNTKETVQEAGGSPSEKFNKNWCYRIDSVTVNGEKHDCFNGSGDYGYALSNNNRTCKTTFTVPVSEQKGGWNAIDIRVATTNVEHNGKAIGEKTYKFEFTKDPSAPYLNSLHDSKGKVTGTSFALDMISDSKSVQYQYRKKGTSKWISGTSKSKLVTIKKLKANTTYQLRFQSKITAKNSEGKSATVKSGWSSPTTLSTAPSKPSISSISVTNKKTSRYWQSGYWTSHTSSGRWIPGRYVTSTNYDVTITLAKKTSATSCYVKHGTTTLSEKIEKDGRTIKMRSVPGTYQVQLIANPTYENEMAGLSAWSAKRSS